MSVRSCLLCRAAPSHTIPTRVQKICPHCRTEYGPDTLICPNDGARLDAPVEQADSLIGSLLADRYRVLRMLGEGGMGRVYLAEHVRMGRMSAVKVMSPALAPTADAISRFNREAANASRINHPNVAAIYDFGETADGTLYLAMEYVDGETLASLVRRTGSLPLPLVGELTRQIADALNAAHQFGIVHRDLKPDNILVTRDADDHYLIKVVDFGIAKTTQAAGQTVTTVGMSIGTPEYMSPEQLAGEPLDARTDIYSLGLVAFSMLTGETPFPDISSKKSLVQRLTTRPRTLREVRPSVTWPDRLQAALDRALSPEPDDRYRKVGDFAIDIVAATGTSAAFAEARTRAMTPLGIAAITTPAPPSPASPNKSKRAPVVVALVAAAAAVIAAVLVTSTRQSSVTPPAAIRQLPVTADTTRLVVSPAASVPTSLPAVKYTGVASPRIRQQPASQPRSADSSRALSKARDSVAAARSVVIAPVTPAPGQRLETEVSAPPPLPSTDATRRVRRAGSHAWLNAKGDSSGTLDAATPLIVEAREIMGHVNRARHFFAVTQPAKAMPELRTAYEEYLAFVAEHPGAFQAQVLRKQLIAVTDTALAGCPARSDSIAPKDRHGAMCAGLAKAAALAAQGGRMGGNPFQPNRRVPRSRVVPER